MTDLSLPTYRIIITLDSGELIQRDVEQRYFRAWKARPESCLRVVESLFPDWQEIEIKDSTEIHHILNAEKDD
jgi:hypothetical protein